MSSSLLERARGFHEDLEIYERAIIEQLENKPRTQKARDTRTCTERKNEEFLVLPTWFVASAFRSCGLGPLVKGLPP